jgi:hypothetical protein
MAQLFAPIAERRGEPPALIDECQPPDELAGKLYQRLLRDPHWEGRSRKI